ncbi:FkbM family methyltransferase [Salipiger sp.]|uniref:FkbM family methyltransferase n=1 Tax=Salipiger sp. TaxID=2078585 RepID=UPI003A97C77D
MKTTEVTYPSNRYGRYCVPAGLEDRPAAKAVIAGQVYEPDTITFMRKHAGDGDIIHAGTFFGDFLPALSSAMAPGRKVWAFEPNPGNYDAAVETWALNGLENVELFNAALSNRIEKVLFRTRDEKGRPLGGLSHFVLEEGPGVEPVQSAMLDFTVPLERRVSILQLDVEGHEKQAIRGAFHIIYRWRPILILEYFAQEQWITRTFRGLGYRKIGKLHGNFVYAADDTEI